MVEKRGELKIILIVLLTISLFLINVKEGRAGAPEDLVYTKSATGNNCNTCYANLGSCPPQGYPYLTIPRDKSCGALFNIYICTLKCTKPGTDAFFDYSELGCRNDDCGDCNVCSRMPCRDQQGFLPVPNNPYTYCEYSGSGCIANTKPVCRKTWYKCTDGWTDKDNDPTNGCENPPASTSGPDYCTLKTISIQPSQSGVTTVSCPERGGICLKIEGLNQQNAYESAASGNKQYIGLGWINTANLGVTNSGGTFISVYQYDSDGKLLDPTKEGSKDYFNIGGLGQYQGWTFFHKPFETEAGTVKIKLVLQNRADTGITGYSLFGPIYFAPAESCIETNCNDGMDDDFDLLFDFADPDCRNSNYCPSLIDKSFLNPFLPSAPNGSDSCCGDDNQDWVYEGIAGYIYNYQFQLPKTTQLYRLQGHGDHFYTTNKQEADNADLNLGYDYEESSYFIYDAPIVGTVPLYRLLSPTNFHFYTTDLYERDYAVNTLHFKFEVIAGYIYSFPFPNTIPFYRLYNPIGDHLYVTDSNLEGHGPKATDLGFIGPSSKQFFCNYEPIQSIPKWNWFDATSNELYKIHAVSGFNVISNTQNWSYCNADNTGFLNGEKVGNYQTFLDALPNGQCWCDIPEGFQVTSDCNRRWPEGNGGQGCCKPNRKYDCDNELQSEACYSGINTCYDANGPYVPPGGGGGGGGGNIGKGGFKFGYEYYGNPDLTCAELNRIKPTSVLCDPDKTCQNGYFIASNNYPKKCCYGSNPYCSSGDETKTCAEQGSELIPRTAEVICNGLIIHSSDEDNEHQCCYGGYSWATTKIKSQQGNKSFICYSDANRNLFGECCSDDSCYNKDIGVEDFDSGNIFATGSPLHTIQSFNVLDDSGAHDFIHYYVMDPNSRGYKRIDVSTKHTDFTPYKTLEFDFGYNGTVALTNVSFANEDDEEVWTDYIKNYTLDGGSNANVWHHVIIDVTNLVYNGQHVNPSNVVSIKIKYISIGGGNLYVDNFLLKAEQDKGLDSYYCTGAFRSWIKDLNPTNFNPDDFNSYGPYWYACDSQLSFSWTGKRCCGSLSSVGGDSVKEFYNDTWSGCFGGVTIHNDERVSDSYRNPAHYPNIMYYAGQFFQCGGNPTTFTGIYWNNNYDNITTNVSAYFTVRGSYYCALDNKWRNLSDISKTRIIASSMYNFTANKKADYTLFCENANESINDPSLISFENLQNFCVLRYNESSEENIIVGVGVNDLQTFMDNINSYIELIGSDDLQKIEQTEIEACIGKRSTDEEFYVQCIDKPGLNLYYNDKFKIVIFSQKPIEGWHKGFFQLIWEFLKKLFEGIFGINKPEEGKIPVLDSYAAFDRLYIANYSGRFVKAIAEDVGEEGNTTIDVDYENINLTNVTDISYIETHSRKITFSKRTETSGELIIEKPQNNDLFTYLTAINRFEVYQGGGGGGNGNENQN